MKHTLHSRKRHKWLRQRMKKSGKILETFTAKQLTEALNDYDNCLKNGLKTRFGANVNRVANLLRQEKEHFEYVPHPTQLKGTGTWKYIGDEEE